MNTLIRPQPFVSRPHVASDIDSVAQAWADINSVQRAGGERSHWGQTQAEGEGLPWHWPSLLSSLTTCSYNKHPEPTTSLQDFFLKLNWIISKI